MHYNVQPKSVEPRVHDQPFCMVQIEPPGINLIYLPYSDDIRSPETDPSFVGSTAVHASQEQVQLALDMMSSLQLPDFDCCDIPNPVLQRHFQVRHLIQASIFSDVNSNGLNFCCAPRFGAMNP